MIRETPLQIGYNSTFCVSPDDVRIIKVFVCSRALAPSIIRAKALLQAIIIIQPDIIENSALIGEMFLESCSKYPNYSFVKRHRSANKHLSQAGFLALQTARP